MISKYINKTTSSINYSDFSISTISEYKKYSESLHQRTVFPYMNKHMFGGLSQVSLSFRFRSIEFSKKRALPFFLAIELLTHRKGIASLSKRNVQSWKIRQGRLVGCKVSLRSEALSDFIDTLSLTLPRREKFQPTRNFLIKMSKKTNFRKVDPSYSVSLGELVLFYPIELGLGLHPDVQRIEVKFIFSCSSVEEQYFFLRYSKVPIFLYIVFVAQMD